MVFARVELYFRVLKECLLRFANLKGAGGIFLVSVGSNDFRPALENEFSAIDPNFPFGAEEVHAETILVLHRDSIRINQFGAAFCARVGWRKGFDGAAGIHPQAPLGNIQMVS